MFLQIFKHLLPNARAWAITTNKQLRQFFDGLSLGLGNPLKLFIDLIWQDIDPQKTRELDTWESQFGLVSGSLTTQERHDRLDAAWKAKGGQDPRYIEDTLRAAGFDVYVHEWWVPGSESNVNVLAAATARNPFDYLHDGVSPLKYIALDGGVDSQDGDALAQDGATLQPTGYPLVNKLLIFDPDYLGDGSLDMQDGDELAQDGAIPTGIGSVYNQRQYVIPSDVTKWPYFLYIGGQTFPNHAIIASSRRNEFETLCLKIRPAQVWLGILVDYS